MSEEQKKRGRKSKTMNQDTKKESVHCSFCGKSQKDAKRLIAAPNDIFICDECVQICQSVLQGEEKHHTEGLTRDDIQRQKELCYEMFAMMAKLQGWLANELKALDDAEKKYYK